MKTIVPVEFQTNFIVMPKHCNYMYPMIFGGALFAELDLAAASCVNEILYYSPCDSAVTHKFTGEFHAAANSGDLVLIEACVIELRHKAVVVKVEAWKQPRAAIIPGKVPGTFTKTMDGTRETTKIATLQFVFVTKANGMFRNHDLELEKD